MRNFVLSVLGLSTLAATTAFAADLPSRRAPPVYVPPPIPAFTWTGFYVGANAGAAFNRRQTNSYYLPNGSVAGSGGTDGVLTLGGGSRTAFTGGGQIGYNYQFNPGPSVVVGVEADAQYIGRGGRNGNYTFSPTTPLSYGAAFVPVAGLAAPTVVSNTNSSQFFGTVRGRLGYAFDRVYVYGTGGLAYNDRAAGYAAGGGLEYAFTNNISVRGEYLYVNLNRGGASVNPVFDAASNTVTLNNRGGRDNFSVARAAINYKIDVPVAPIVARY